MPESTPGCLGHRQYPHRRIAIKGTLLGGLIDKGFSLELVIVSDGAEQLAILPARAVLDACRAAGP